MRRLAAIAVTCYAAGYGLGTLACHISWLTVSHEHRYQLPARWNYSQNKWNSDPLP